MDWHFGTIVGNQGKYRTSAEHPTKNIHSGRRPEVQKEMMLKMRTEQGILLHYQKIQNLGHKGTKTVFYQTT